MLTLTPEACHRALLARRADELDARIRHLTAMRDGLRHAAVCGAEDHMVCPRFRRLLGIAASRRDGGRRSTMKGSRLQ